MEDNRSMNIDVIMRDPAFVELAMKVMEMEADIDEDYLVPFEPDEEDEDTGVKIVKTRQGDYGQEISYVPSRYIKKRVDLAFKQKWSFFIVAERREVEPFQRWSKQDEDYVDGSNYLRCIGMMVVPGLGIRMEYGVKKVFGDAESSDWKACKTDAFKKCAEAFGIYLNYEDNDDDEEESGGRRGKGKGGKVDLSDVEYTDDDLDDAFSEEIGFGKYKGSTLQEIYEDEDDISYIEWLAENARDDDMRFYASVILKYNDDQEEEKSNHRRDKSKGKSSKSSSTRGRSGKSSGRGGSKSSKGKDNYMNPPEDEDDEEEESGGRRGNKSGSRRSSSSSKSSGKGRKSSDEDDDEMATLIEGCRAVLDEYDRVQAKSVMASVTTSNKYPRGKSKLDQFTLDELRELADVLEV